LGEEIQGLSNILATLTAEVRQAEMKASEAATHYDNMVKLKAFADQEITRKRLVLRKLLEEDPNIER
jgi:TnpA family transposase